jgi:hypothetical protein
VAGYMERGGCACRGGTKWGKGEEGRKVRVRVHIKTEVTLTDLTFVAVPRPFDRRSARPRRSPYPFLISTPRSDEDLRDKRRGSQRHLTYSGG